MFHAEPKIINNNRYMLILDLDDTLTDGNLVGLKRDLFFPESVKKVLEIARNNPNVFIYFISSATMKDEVVSLLLSIPNINLKEADLNSTNVQIFGKETLGQLVSKKFGIVDKEVETNGVLRSHVLWVDDGIGDILKAQERGYTPILVPWIEKPNGKKDLANSSYLDCLPELVTMQNLSTFAHQAMLINGKDPITADNYMSQAAADSLTKVYKNPKALAGVNKNPEESTRIYKDPKAFVATEKFNVQELEVIAASHKSVVFMQMENFPSKPSFEDKMTSLRAIAVALPNVIRLLNTDERQALTEFLNKPEFRNDKNKELQASLASLKTMLSAPSPGLWPTPKQANEVKAEIKGEKTLSKK